VYRFERLAAEGRPRIRDDPAQAARLLREALGLAVYEQTRARLVVAASALVSRLGEAVLVTDCQ
jgi:hypothetical protein